jgi:hypothetical protein
MSGSRTSSAPDSIVAAIGDVVRGRGTPAPHIDAVEQGGAAPVKGHEEPAQQLGRGRRGARRRAGVHRWKERKREEEEALTSEPTGQYDQRILLTTFPL